MIEFLDKNKDGEVHRSEVNKDAEINFDAIDKNKDDKLSFDELYAAMLPAGLDHEGQLIDSDVNELLRNMDHSGDGIISLEEGLQGREHLLHHVSHYEL